MKLGWGYHILLLASLPAVGMTQSLPTNASDVLATLTEALPPCALTCILTSVKTSTCAITNFACICANAPLAGGIQTCLTQTCTVVEQLQTEKFQKTTCGAPRRNISNQLEVIIWVFYSLAFTSVTLRVFSRLPYVNSNLFGDDWTIIACLVALTYTCAFGHLMANSGIGQDIWELSQKQISDTMFYFFLAEFGYTFTVTLTKISIVLLYLRIFPAQRFRYTCYCFSGIVFAFGLSCFVVSLLICRPISLNWNAWDGEHAGTCGNTNLQVYVTGAVNMTLDLVTFLLPIPQLLPLVMSWKKKVGIILMFLVGLFVTVCSIVRLTTLIKYGKSMNPTFAVWSLVEIHVGVICACMPGMAALLRRIWPRIFGSQGSSRPSQGYSHTFPKGASSHKLSGQKLPISKGVAVRIEYADMSASKEDEIELVGRPPHKSSKSGFL